MAGRRRDDRDPRRALVRVVERLGRRRPFVTFGDVERAWARAYARPPGDELATLMEDAVAESMLLKDLRTFFDRKSGAFSEQWVYRVNPRHPLAAALLDES